MLTNAIGGLQGIVDHVLVGNLVGYKANAAIGVSWQIFLVVIVFISSLFTGMSVLVARFAGAGEADKVDRVVYQAFLTAIGLSLGILAPVGYVASPWLLDLVNATPAVQAQALPYLRILFGFSSGMMIFFMLTGALRSAGDARTPMILGIAMTVLNLLLNIVLIRGIGPIPAFGTRGSSMGTCISGGLVATYALWRLWAGGWVVAFPRGRGLGPDWTIIRELFRFGLPTGIQGIAMNIGGVFMLSFIGSLAQSAAAQAAFAVSYSGLFITVALAYTGGLQGTGDTKSPLYISMISQILVPLGICFVIRQTGTLDPIDIWLAILAGHVTRCVLSVLRFRQGQWRTIALRI